MSFGKMKVLEHRYKALCHTKAVCVCKYEENGWHRDRERESAVCARNLTKYRTLMMMLTKLVGLILFMDIIL